MNFNSDVIGQEAWYILRVSNGDDAKCWIEKTCNENEILKSTVKEVFLPKESMIDARRKKKIAITRDIFPNYLFVKMTITKQSYRIIVNCEYITCFLRYHTKKKGDYGFKSITEQEVQRFRSKAEEPAKEIIRNFEKNDVVKVIEGAFVGFTGRVVNQIGVKVNILVRVFGDREVLTEVDANSVVKL